MLISYFYFRGRVASTTVNGYHSTPSRHSGSGATSPRVPATPERQRTRPCIYCGKFFYDLENLFRHESAEAIEFEKETERFENEKPSIGPGDFDDRSNLSYQQVIDRTVEEFGEDDEDFDLNYIIDRKECCLGDQSIKAQIFDFLNSVLIRGF